MTKQLTIKSSWVLCIDNAGYPASLERGKLYRTKSDRIAAADGFIRVVDESGEDYLYPSEMFEPIQLSDKIKRALKTA